MPAQRKQPSDIKKSEWLVCSQNGYFKKFAEGQVWARICHLLMTGICQPMWRPDANSKSYKFPFQIANLDLLSPLAFEQLRIGS